MRHHFFKMASANVSKLFHQFRLVATLLLQHGLLYVDITYRQHVNKRSSIYYAVKRTIAQKFNPRSRANSAKSNYMRISNPLNRVVPVCSNRDPDKAGWPGCHVINVLKKTNDTGADLGYCNCCTCNSQNLQRKL